MGFGGFFYLSGSFEGDLIGGDLVACLTGDFCFDGRPFCFPF
jgi:hypothetical protein